MAWSGCKHLLCAQKCVVPTNPPSSSSQKTYKGFYFLVLKFTAWELFYL